MITFLLGTIRFSETDPYDSYDVGEDIFENYGNAYFMHVAPFNGLWKLKWKKTIVPLNFK